MIPVDAAVKDVEKSVIKAVASGNAAFFKRKVSHFKKWG